MACANPTPIGDEEEDIVQSGDLPDMVKKDPNNKTLGLVKACEPNFGSHLGLSFVKSLTVDVTEERSDRSSEPGAARPLRFMRVHLR